MNVPITLDEYEAYAQERLPTVIFDYFAGGAQDERTLRANREAWLELRLRPRVLRDVSSRDLRTEVLGSEISMPVLVAPTAFQRMAHDEGELATARAAGAAGTILTLSTLSTQPMEEVAAAGGGAFWFQLYLYRDREVTRALVERVEAAGATALILTVDAPVWGARERDVRNGFHLPDGLRVANLGAGERSYLPDVQGSALAAYANEMFDPSLGWADLEWLRRTSRLPILVKGISRGDDAREAIARGAAGVIVSNHGGRQLDTAAATAEVLPEVVEAVGGAGEVLVDGGIRRGTDVVKALAIGAKAVLLGRPILWGLAVGGEEGVLRVLEVMRAELDLAMALCGARSVSEITGDLIA